jgi:anti-anti-sigma regulatory factor
MAGLLFGELVCTSISLALIRRGRVDSSVAVLAFSLLVMSGGMLLIRGLIQGSYLFYVLALPISLAGLFAGRWVLRQVTVATVLLLLALAALEAAGRPFLSPAPSATNPLISFMATAIFVTALLWLFFDRTGSQVRTALTEALARERELEAVRTNQEQVIAARTADLQAALSEVQQREARLASTLEQLQSAQIAIEELSAPIIPVLPGVLIVPLIGAIDSGRAQVLASTLLSAVERSCATYVIFDITGVPIVDTQVAKVLLQTTAALRLLGARVILVGIRPEVAQTIVGLNLDLGALSTIQDLQGALTTLLTQRNGHLAQVG